MLWTRILIFCAITETSLNPGDCDDFVIRRLIPNGYRFLHSAREGRGGGVGLLFKSLLKVKQTSTCMDYLDTITSFEAMEVEVEVSSQIVSILIVHRPPPSSANNPSTSLFMNEFSSLLESYIIKTGSLLIAGDFNFHVDDTSDAVAANFLGLLESFDVRQHVHSYTHRAGHTLDLVISHSAESILNVTSVDDSSIISDHYTVCADLQFVKPSWERKHIRTRKL